MWSWPSVVDTPPRTGSYGAPSTESAVDDAPAARVKVLHVITKFSDGAGGNTLLTVLGADHSRFDIWVAGSPGGPLWGRAEAHGIRTVKVARLRADIAMLDDLSTLLELVRLMRRERFDIVHTHSSKAGLLGRTAAWIARAPVVVHTIHGFSWHDQMSRRRRLLYLTLERLARPLTDAFLAVAPQVAKEAVDQGVAPANRVSVVPSAIELDAIPSSYDPRVRELLEIPEHSPLVGTVGRLDYQKAPLDFVRMAALISATRPDARFVIVGEGPLLNDAQAEARRLGVEIAFPGYRADAAQLAAGFDVYVVSSLYEGLGRSLCEALASGRPVVAAAVNGVVDVVETGKTGLLVPAGSPSELAKSIGWILDHPEQANAMANAGQALVRSLFQPSVMCDLIEEVYMRELGRNEAEAPRATPRDRNQSNVTARSR